MYRLKDDKDLLEQYRANIELRKNSKIKFKTRTTKLTKVANSPYYRGVRLWDRLNESTQKATTKAKFKQLNSWTDWMPNTSITFSFHLCTLYIVS